MLGSRGKPIPDTNCNVRHGRLFVLVPTCTIHLLTVGNCLPKYIGRYVTNEVSRLLPRQGLEHTEVGGMHEPQNFAGGILVVIAKLSQFFRLMLSLFPGLDGSSNSQHWSWTAGRCKHVLSACDAMDVGWNCLGPNEDREKLRINDADELKWKLLCSHAG